MPLRTGDIPRDRSRDARIGIAGLTRKIGTKLLRRLGLPVKLNSISQFDRKNPPNPVLKQENARFDGLA